MEIFLFLAADFTDFGIFINRRERRELLATKAQRHEDIKKKLDADFTDFAEDFVDGITGLTEIMFLPALASLSESLFDASIYRSFVLIRRVIFQCPIWEAGEKGV